MRGPGAMVARLRPVTRPGFAFFDTAIGRCGIAWTGRGVSGVQLPEKADPETRARLRQRFPAALEATPPAAVRRVLDRIVAHLRGEKVNLSRAALDMERVPPFHRRVYEMARSIAPGTTLSYGDVAERIGSPGSARAVGQALGRNPFAIVVPCHRVLAAGGKIGGFSADGGVTTKIRLLSLEGVRVNSDSAPFLGRMGGWHLSPVPAVSQRSVPRKKSRP